MGQLLGIRNPTPAAENESSGLQTPEAPHLIAPGERRVEDDTAVDHEKPDFKLGKKEEPEASSVLPFHVLEAACMSLLAMTSASNPVIVLFMKEV